MVWMLPNDNYILVKMYVILVSYIFLSFNIYLFHWLQKDFDQTKAV